MDGGIELFFEMITKDVSDIGGGICWDLGEAEKVIEPLIYVWRSERCII